jgi:hypothetical protein
VESLFSGARYIAQQVEQAITPSVESGIAIELADNDPIEQYAAEELAVFEQSLAHTVLTVDRTPVWDSARFDIIPGLLMRDGYSMYDDLLGTGFDFGPPKTTVIPEPANAALLALGLLGLALRARLRAA